MKKMKLKPFVKVSFVGLIMCLSLVGIFLASNNNSSSKVMKEDNYTYVNDYIFDNYYPVANQEEKITRPYVSSNVSIYKNFYENEDDDEKQQNSIIFHENTYMQNSGVDYKSEEQFDVVASIGGTVTNISDDPLLGKTIEVKNSNEIIVMYQSLGEVLVKKGELVTQGQIIAKSGKCTLNKDINNGLHLEIYKNGQIVNPEKYFDKTLKELLEK